MRTAHDPATSITTTKPRRVLGPARTTFNPALKLAREETHLDRKTLICEPVACRTFADEEIVGAYSEA